MKIELNQDRLCLTRNQVMKVQGGIGHTVVCHRGAIWVTQYGDLRDVVLHAGETFTLDRDGIALMQAFAQSAISIRRPDVKTPASGLPVFARSGIFGAVFTRASARA